MSLPPSPPLSLVIDTLKDVDPSRKCFRLVGGVLVERTVKEVLPALQTNKEQVTDRSLQKKPFFWWLRKTDDVDVHTTI